MTAADVRSVVRGLVPTLHGLYMRIKALEAKAELPPVPGPAGTNGRDGLPGVPGHVGEKGADGKDGRDGKDGQDGLGFDDLDVVFDAKKGWALRFTKGVQFREFPLPIPFDAGVWEFGRLYPKGAGVTVKGAYWLALKPTKSRPDDGTPDSVDSWRLAVKAGRDGKPGKDGKDGGE